MNDQRQSVTAFYDSIAKVYNDHMTDSDRQARESVQRIFTQYVPGGNVMDFGGGTGLDLPWLLDNNYNVFFVEPSANMRAVAAQSIVSTANLRIIDINTDFIKWKENTRPFSEKVNGIIANFAVLNCIKDIDCLFEKFSVVASDDCRVITTIIDPRFGGMMKSYSILPALKMIFTSRLRIDNRHEGKLHPTYIHSMRSILNASKAHFDLLSIEPLEVSSFVVLIFRRK